MHLEIAIWKFFNNGYRKYLNLCPTKSVNVTENDSANSINAAETDS